MKRRDFLASVSAASMAAPAGLLPGASPAEPPPSDFHRLFLEAVERDPVYCVVTIALDGTKHIAVPAMRSVEARAFVAARNSRGFGWRAEARRINLAGAHLAREATDLGPSKPWVCPEPLQNEPACREPEGGAA